MQTGNIIRLYESGLRGRPVAHIRPGDLDDPYDRSLSPWQRAVSLWSTLVDIVRETRAMERELLGRTTYRGLE
jgi:hypothetical protein